MYFFVVFSFAQRYICEIRSSCGMEQRLDHIGPKKSR